MTRAKDPETEELLRREGDRVSMLRMQMLESHPFWGYLLLQFRMIPCLELPTFAATDCVRRIWYNPRFTRHLTAQQLGFVLAHEVGHQVLLTVERCVGRNLHLWNCATDYAINRIVAQIKKPGFHEEKMYHVPEATIPELGKVRPLLDARFEEMIAEQIYEVLAKEELEAPRVVTLRLCDSTAEGEDAEEIGRIDLPDVADHHGGIDVHIPVDISPEQAEELRERLRAAVETWRRSAQRGDLPGGYERELFGPMRAVVPWQRVFRNFLGQATATDDYSLTRPNKRYLEQDLVVPGHHSERIGMIVVALDTSGSMSKEQISELVAELTPLSAMAEEVILIVADAKVHEVVSLDELPRWLDAAKARGGGGTDHRPVFKYIEEHRLAPEVLIGLTDLYSAFPKLAPRFPVVWVVPPDHGEAPWGRVIELE